MGLEWDNELPLQDRSDRRMRRRGLIAGAAALVAGALAKQATQSVAADNTALIIGTQNPSTAETQLNNTNRAANYPALYVDSFAQGIEGHINAGSTITGTIAVRGVNDGVGDYPVGVAGYCVSAHGVGITGTGGLIGAQGTLPSSVTTMNLPATQGVNFVNLSGSTGVQGLIPQSNEAGTVPCTASGTLGMEGRNESAGTVPAPDGNIGGNQGVLGTIAPANLATSDRSIAVGGLNLSTAPVTFGVLAQSFGSNGAGIYGINNSTGVGLQGSSNGGYGLTGVSSATDYHSAVYGFANAAGATAIRGGGVPGSRAAIFDGDVTISGTLTIGGSKSAYVKHPDGSHRLLYCVEAPESWFEDFGEGKLINGRADVQLDADFAAVVDTSELHVFVTAHDDRQLYVPQRTASGFTVVTSSTGGQVAGVRPPESGATFSYRVIARRKDTKAARLAKFEPPAPAIPPPLHEPPVPARYQERYREALAKVGRARAPIEP